MKQALLLGRGGRALDILHWKDAVLLAYFRDNTAFALDFHDVCVYSEKQAFRIPSVLMLTGEKDKYPNYDKLPLNKHNLFIRDDWQCQYCGKKITITSGTIDHCFPLGRKGTNTWRNVVAACKHCNTLKNNRTVQEFEDAFGLKLMRKPYIPSRAVMFRKYLVDPEYVTWQPFLKKYFKN